MPPKNNRKQTYIPDETHKPYHCSHSTVGGYLHHRHAADNNTAEGKERGYLTINRQTAEAHIGFLASDELQGREAGYPSGRIAANYAEACLRATGLEPWDGKTYRQPFAAYRRERQKKDATPSIPTR